MWGTVSIFVCLHVGRRCEYSFAVHEGGNICLCICVLVVYVYVSGRALDSASLIILVDPHPPPCPAGGGCRRCVGDFSRRGRMLGRAPAHSRRSIGGAWPYWPCWAPIGGWGPLGLRAQGPVRPGVVGCRWSLRACRHGTLGRLHCGCWRSRLRALLCPFLGGGRGCPCGGSPGGPVPWGASGCLGPGSFPCLLHALRDGAVVPHTHY